MTHENDGTERCIEALEDLSERINRAMRSLTVLRDAREPGKPAHARLSSKMEGLALAASYLDDELHIVRGGSR